MSDVSNTKQFENKLDNGNLQEDRSTKDIAAAYTEYDEMKAYRMYLETLKLESEMQGNEDKIVTRIVKADGTLETKEIKIQDLVPDVSEFEHARRIVLAMLNQIKRKADGSGHAQLKQLYAEFETDSVFELSSKIANYKTDKARRVRVDDMFDYSKLA